MTVSKAIFTIITKSYLAYARVMAKELRARHPEIPFYVFLADRPDSFFAPDDEPFHIVLFDDIIPAELLGAMTGYYTAYEFSNAIKPFAHLYISKLSDVKQWLYFDSDIYIVSSLKSLFIQLEETSILISPHIFQADVMANHLDIELLFLRCGTYNGGFVGIKHSNQALQFITWWKERLVWHCLHNSPGLEADQSWLNFIPSLFPDYKLVRDPGVNVAYWNIHERPLEIAADGGYSVLGNPVSFIHFSGWDWRNPDLPTRNYNIELGSSKNSWQQAARNFANQLQSCGIEICSRWPYSFAKAKNGQDLTTSMRRNYRARLRGQDKSAVVPSIFDEPEAFEDLKGPEPKKTSLWGATRMWLGVVKRCLLRY